MKKLLLICAFFYFGINAHSQDSIPTSYFSNPLDIPLILSGSFGELRSNHFHSGLDIKTQQREGIPVYAPADGFVNRIKVAFYGYGKALYIQHPNGFSTVYAHLQKFAGEIENYVKTNQYRKESFEIELFPEPNALVIKKGDLIGYTGNTGSSGGPHLHYEIRDEHSRPMNPMLFGVEIPDTKIPIVNSIIAYPISEDAHVDMSNNRKKLRLTLQNDGSYKSEKIKAFGTIGFGISTNDQQNGASNKNGVYRIKSTFNGEERFEVLFEKFSFAETRYQNRYIDYEYYAENKSRIQKLFREPNNPLSIIKHEVDNGLVQIEDSLTAIYKIEVTDYKNNAISIVIPIEGHRADSISKRQVVKTDDYIYADQATSISKEKFNIFIPENSLYENTYLHINAQGDTLHFHEDNIPIHKNITISTDVSVYNETDREKLYLGRANRKGKPYYNTTIHKGDRIETRTRTFGSYVLVTDEEAPTIKPLNFHDGKWISNNKTLKIKIKDDMSGIKNYRATINDTFILMEYDYKKNVLVYDFDDAIVDDTENNLKLIVIDNVGNSATFEATFFRK